MKSCMFQARAAAMALVLSALTAASLSAGCANTGSQSPSAFRSVSQTFQAMKARQQSQRAGARAQAPQAASPSIVGYWHTVFLIDPDAGYSTAGPNVFDEGFDAWHADGTETLNDISPPPTGNVCIGVWAQTGPLTYVLKHPSWFYGEDNTTVIGVGTITEQVTLDPSGNSYSGTVTINLIDLTDANLFHAEATLMAERLTADTEPFMPTPPSGVMPAAVVTPSSLTTTEKSITLDGSGSTGAGALTYFYSVLPGGKVPAILQTPASPKAIVQFVNGPGTYLVQLKVTDSAGNSATSDPITLVYSQN